MIINYAIALAFSERKEQANQVLDKENWSALSWEFKLAQQVLKENYKESANLMRRIGKTGEMIIQHSYHIFPLFKYFRQTKDFLDAYNELYGYPFVDELKRTADEDKEQGETEIEKIRTELREQPLVKCSDSIQDSTSTAE
jgi:diadenosine tetraphosphate (Ap4A) HIT family hydrolase